MATADRPNTNLEEPEHMKKIMKKILFLEEEDLGEKSDRVNGLVEGEIKLIFPSYINFSAS